MEQPNLLRELLITLGLVTAAAFGGALWVQVRYPRQVARTMRRGAVAAPGGHAGSEGRRPAPPGPEVERYSWRRRPKLSARAAVWSRYARRARGWAIGIYAAAAAAHLLTSLLVLRHAAARHAGAPDALFADPLLTGLIFLCPLLLTLGVVTVASAWLRLFTGLFYGSALAYLVARRAPVPHELWMLLLTVGVPAFLKMTLMNRRLKSAGTLTLMFVASLAVGLFAAWRFASWDGAGWPLTVVLMACAGACAGRIGWWFVANTARRYGKKLSSDQSVVLDNFWLLQTECFAFFFTLLYGWRGLLAAAGFVSYVVVLVLGFRLKRRFLRERRSFRLLLLRTFEKPERDPRRRAFQRLKSFLRLGRPVLFERVEARWRYAGSIDLITGTDLAQETLDPDEFHDFVRGRMTDRHVAGAEALRRLAEARDERRDPDGRYRVNEFLCYDNTWHDAVRKLISMNDAVLFDLRGFTRERTGVVKELGTLFDLARTSKLVFVADHTTDFEQLYDIVEQKWAASAGAPGRHTATPALRILYARSQSTGVAEAVAGMLFEAASRRAPSAARAGGRAPERAAV